MQTALEDTAGPETDLVSLTARLPNRLSLILKSMALAFSPSVAGGDEQNTGADRGCAGFVLAAWLPAQARSGPLRRDPGGPLASSPPA